ncbi:hypothetical protein [Hymenobacter yonginensis]|uniref:Uncharacterized protein n=1 Tax=Hymenobacter yonginensis TaxID=748197 RepID=A0ABY7PUW3_9BACT|nr:hypothetical protein [Hymenobacter yonginensis]WBO86702.1 hypothetical protein O9Z63_20695 [Hymenobacter yonginensis]
MKPPIRLFFLAFLAVLLPLASQAQQMQEIRGVPQPPQVLPLDDQGYALFYRSEAGEEGQDIYALRLLDPALNVRHQYALPVPVGAAMLPRLDGKTTFALPFHDQSAARLSLYTFNPQTGAQLRRDLVAEPDRRRVPTGRPLIAMTPTEGFCLVQPFRRDTAGYTVTVLDKDLKTQWSRMYFPADLRQHVPLQVAVSKDLITLVLSDSYTVNPNTPKQRGVTDLAVLGLDRGTGKMLFRTPVRQDKFTLLPTQLLPLADGRVVAAGVYTQPQATRRDSVLGVFMTAYRADGQAVAPTLTPWAELAAATGEPALGRRLYEGKGSFRLLELLTTTGADATLVAEYGAAQPGPFVVLTYPAAAGGAATVYPVARTFKTLGTPAEQRLSSYRGVIGRQGEPTLVYTGVEGNQAYAYATVLANTPTRSATRALTEAEKLPELPAYSATPPMASSPALDRLTGRLGSLQQKLNTGVEAVNKAVNGPQGPPVVNYQPDQLANFVVGPRGQVLVYRYEISRKMLRYQLQPLK